MHIKFLRAIVLLLFHSAPIGMNQGWLLTLRQRQPAGLHNTDTNVGIAAASRFAPPRSNMYTRLLQSTMESLVSACTLVPIRNPFRPKTLVVDGNGSPSSSSSSSANTEDYHEDLVDFADLIRPKVSRKSRRGGWSMPVDSDDQVSIALA